MICGTRGNPGTVAPFRAWRGSRDLVAQSPRFHAPAVTPRFARLQRKILTQRREREQSRFKFPHLGQSKNENLFFRTRPVIAHAWLRSLETPSISSGRVRKFEYSRRGRIFLPVLLVAARSGAGPASASGTPHVTGPTCTLRAGRRTSQ